MMAVIYLRHPTHGTKVAISEIEAYNDFENGWEEFDPTMPMVDEPPPMLETINQLQPRRKGRPPRENAA